MLILASCGGEATAQRSVDSCSFLTTEQVSTFLGEQSLPGTKTSTETGCYYKAKTEAIPSASSSLLVSLTQKDTHVKFLESRSIAAKSAGEVIDGVPSLGGDEVFSYLSADSKVRGVEVRKGQTRIRVILSAEGSTQDMVSTITGFVYEELGLYTGGGL